MRASYCHYPWLANCSIADEYAGFPLPKTLPDVQPPRAPGDKPKSPNSNRMAGAGTWKTPTSALEMLFDSPTALDAASV